MNESHPPMPWWKQSALDVWRSPWTKALAIIFAAFEIYNNAVLPAIKGTYETKSAISQATITDAEAQKKKAELRYLLAPANGITGMSFKQRKKLICKDPEMREKYDYKYHCNQ